MEYQGKVIDGVVVLNDGQKLPDGTPVRVSTLGELPPLIEVFRDLGEPVEGLPSDLARNHDHYLHGAPKR